MAQHPRYADRPWPSTQGTIHIVAGIVRPSAHPRIPAFSIDGKVLSDGNAALAWIGDLMLGLRSKAAFDVLEPRTL